MADGLPRPPSRHQRVRRPVPESGPVSPCFTVSLKAKALSTHGSRKQRRSTTAWTRFGRRRRDPPTAQPRPPGVRRGRRLWSEACMSEPGSMRRLEAWGQAAARVLCC
ncbi:hypothetical protein ES288_D05G288500v1 [Gossypium darwinii]|uniref:Uncharacterized protein n=1 Tax=Gossypium darwinii TaxID=34276 RepID=A0A5D2CL48_GOSDA|nr:hypothetical protein ES288_D05G288500v1 [Gossypium darwinii]